MLAATFLLNQPQTYTDARGWQMVAVAGEKAFDMLCYEMLPCYRRTAPTALSIFSFSHYLATT